jgi:HEAT repeat protein
MLVKTLADFDPELRVAAAEALGRIGQKTAARPLRRALLDESEPVRYAATRALEAMGLARAVDQPVIARGELFV